MMFRKALLTFGAGIALISQPVVGQETEEMPDFSALASMFEVEPLTAEQEARLPLATSIIERMIPPGAMREMMGPMYDKMLGPIMAMEEQENSATDFVAESLGLNPANLSLSEAQAAELAAMIDPARRERKEREVALFPSLMADVMTVMEPSMKSAMSELYAINFNATELNEIDAFFKTDTGTNFARKSFTMSSDPRIVSATMEALPEMMGMFVSFGEQMEAATADLPAKRGFSELTSDEQARVVELTGYDAENLGGWSDQSEMTVEEDAQ